MTYSSHHMSAQALGHQVGRVIHDWLHSPVNTQVRTSLPLHERLHLIRDLVALLGSPGNGSGLNWEDARDALADARGLWIGRARAQGRDRGQQAVTQLWQSGLQLGSTNTPVRGLLLSIRSGPEKELETEELIAICAAIQARAGEACPLVFGHGIDETLADHVEVLLLVGYS